MATNKEKVRLSLDVSQQLNDTLEELATQMGGTKSDVLRKAIALMEIAVDAQKEGKQIGLAAKGQPLTTIINL